MSRLLHDSTLQKVFREHFKGDSPIVVLGTENKQALISRLKDKLSTIDGFIFLKPSHHQYEYRKSEAVCTFKILSPSTCYRDQDFTIRFNDKNELCIDDRYRVNSPVYELEQVYTLVDKMRLEYNRLDAKCLEREKNKVKKEKIKGLKHQAIIAKINEIAREDQLEFYVIQYEIKVKLVVRLSKTEKMDIDIPYSKFQETLKNLRFTIQTIRELRESGILFKIHRTGYRERGWIKYTDENTRELVKG